MERVQRTDLEELMTAIAAAPASPPPTLRITPWVDPVVDTVGHDPRSTYVERFWLGVLGPSCVWMLRRVADRFEQEPDGFELDVADLAARIGLGARGGKHSPVQRAFERSCVFGVARPDGQEAFAFRRRLPPLARRQLDRLPAAVQREHRLWAREDARRPEAAMLRERARRLALSLLQLGEDLQATEHQLHRWHFHPAIAHDAVTWARAELAAQPPAP
jgi:hypothetical protein